MRGTESVVLHVRFGVGSQVSDGGQAAGPLQLSLDRTRQIAAPLQPCLTCQQYLLDESPPACPSGPLRCRSFGIADMT